MDCTFCQIVNGTKPADVFLRTDTFLVFEPITRSVDKLLIVPLAHYQSLQDVPLPVLWAWLYNAHEHSERLDTASYKMQINVGLQQQNVRHLFMQFSFTRR